MSTTIETPVRTSRRRGVRALVAVLLTAGAVLGTTVAAAPANAYSYTNYGTTGYTSIYAANVNAAPAYPVNSRIIAGPMVDVGRTNAVPAGYPQTVKAKFDLFRYNGKSWTQVDSISRSTYVNYNQSTVRLMADSMGSWARGYYYATRTTITWYDNNGTISGTRVWDTNAVGDYKCNVAYCTSYGSYVLVN